MSTADRPLQPQVIDEAHHSAADSYLRIVEEVRARSPTAMVLGVTATPNRGDGQGLCAVFDNVADEISIAELVRSGHLVRPRTFVLDVGVGADLEQVAMRQSSPVHAGVPQGMREDPSGCRLCSYDLFRPPSTALFNPHSSSTERRFSAFAGNGGLATHFICSLLPPCCFSACEVCVVALFCG